MTDELDPLKAVAAAEAEQLDRLVGKIEAAGWERPRLMKREPEPDGPAGLTRLTYLSEPQTAQAKRFGKIESFALLTPETLEDLDAGRMNPLVNVSEAILDAIEDALK